MTQRRVRAIVGAIVLLGTTSAAAQQPGQVPGQVEKPLVLQVLPSDLSVIAQGLESLPYKVAAPVIARLQSQLVAQQQSAPPSVEPAKSAPSKGGK